MAASVETVYARDGDANLAYQLLEGAGPDLLFVPTPRFPIDLIWDDPTVARHLRRMATFGRLILTDLLGVGSSDAVPINERPAMQAWTDGLLAVLDAVGQRDRDGVRQRGLGATGHAVGRNPPRAGAIARPVEPVCMLPAHRRSAVRHARSDLSEDARHVRQCRGDGFGDGAAGAELEPRCRKAALVRPG